MPLVWDHYKRSRARIKAKLKPLSRLGTLYFYDYNKNTWPATGFAQNWQWDSDYAFLERQATYDELHKGPPWKEGGPFASMRLTSITPYAIQGFNTYLGLNYDKFNWKKYVGGFSPPRAFVWGSPDFTNDWANVSPSSTLWMDLTAYRNQVYSRLRPHLEKASSYVFLAEGRFSGEDSVRMLHSTASRFHDVWKRAGGSTTARLMTPNKVAEDFLNHQFGWAPFLSDMQKLNKAYDDHSFYLSQIRDRNGKWTRHRATLQETSTEVREAQGLGWGGVQPVLSEPDFMSPQVNGVRWEVLTRQTIKVAAQGSFTYYRPEFDIGERMHSAYGNGAEAYHAINRQLLLYGLRVTPSNVYRATPWTWLVDWFTGLDKHIDYLTDIALDGIAAKYMFLTGHIQTDKVFRLYLPFASPGKPLILEWHRIIDVKQREIGHTPYGFDLSWDSLTPRQIALLAAIGITRK
jgi:hypothetical protein